jgi:hypothetical protein
VLTRIRSDRVCSVTTEASISCKKRKEKLCYHGKYGGRNIKRASNLGNK